MKPVPISKAALFFVAILFVASAVTQANTAKFDSDLADSLNKVGDAVRIPVWIELEKPAELNSLLSDVKSAPRETAYLTAMSRLKRAHETAQRGLTRYLQSRMATANDTKMKPHWLINVVEASLTKNELEELANRSDVSAIHLPPYITSIDAGKEDELNPSASTSFAVENNLKNINADDAWAAGFTGQGRVICSFDTGVRGTHNAIRNGWKGLDGDSAAAWFDPVYNQPFPHTIASSSHGTHVIGIMCGHNDGSGDTIGVAPDAKWISAAVIDIPGASIIDAFEWAANPDGDPNTIADVPDVINHSWGVPGVGCTELFFDLIDYTEALGIINVFAAGNDGSANTSIRNPGNRANDSLDCFAIGNLAYQGDTINSNSSRGPSNCNIGARKPNVVAPGTLIRSAFGTGDNNYGNMSGTSMATPHVAGLVALMREKKPNASAEEIKEAILTSTRTGGNIVPGNTYGWGAIDCMAALNELTAAVDPAFRVYNFMYAPVDPGQTARGVLTLQNLGSNAMNVVLTVTGNNPSLSVTSGTAAFGSVGSGVIKSSTDSIRIAVSDTVTEGSLLPIEVTVSSTGGYEELLTLVIVVGDPLSRSVVTHNSGLIQFTVSNFGSFGFANASFYPVGGAGFNYKASGNDVYESGLMISDASTSVSDGVRNLAGEWDGDFNVMAGGNIAITQPGALATQQTFTRMNDLRAENPIGIEFTQETFSFGGFGTYDFIIFRYILKNITTITLSDLAVGLYMDWDLPAAFYNSDAGDWDPTDNYLWAAFNPSSSPLVKRNTRAMAVLDGTTLTAHTGPATDVSLASGGFTETEKFAKLHSGFTTSGMFAEARTDLYQILAAGPITLDQGDVDTVSFVIVAADSLQYLTTAVATARQLYTDDFLSCCKNARGNVNNDVGDATNISDLTFLVNYLFRGGASPVCALEANINGDAGGSINVADLTFLVNFLFRAGASPGTCP